jgi:hypothetical protein
MIKTVKYSLDARIIASGRDLVTLFHVVLNFSVAQEHLLTYGSDIIVTLTKWQVRLKLLSHYSVRSTRLKESRRREVGNHSFYDEHYYL